MQNIDHYIQYMHMDDCIFCKIINKKIPAQVVYEDEEVLAFLDAAPVSRGHTLVVPKTHARNLLEETDTSACELIKEIKHVANAVKDATDAGGLNISFNNEPAAGQEVFHTHAHIIPRFTDDGLTMWGKIEYRENEMEEFADNIREEL